MDNIKLSLSLAGSVFLLGLAFSSAVTPYLDRYKMPEGAVVYQSEFEDENALDQLGWSIDQGQATIVNEGVEGSCLRVALLHRWGGDWFQGFCGWFF